ncbi:putative microsomal epoxide hydrolase [Microsporum audouinii]
MEKRPRALLFDVGGVCVISPFQAILDYEKANKIPIGWINYSIQNTSPDGAWHRLERGEVPLDAAWFKSFNSDFRHQHLWEQFNEKLSTKEKPSTMKENGKTPELPQVDAEHVFWEMMRVAQNPDPYMFPALQKLKDAGLFVMGALSNTTIIPDDSTKLDRKSAAEKQVRRFFDFFISSAHTGLRKPDPRIYELAMKEINDAARMKGLRGEPIRPDEVVFLDDIGVNLKWARKAGMGTIKVSLGRTQEAVRELEKRTGVNLLDDEKARL